MATLLALSGGSIRYQESSGLSAHLWLLGGVFAAEPAEVIFADGFEAFPVTLDSPASGDSVCSADVVLTGHVESDVVQLIINGVDTPLSNQQFISASIALLDGANEIGLEAVLSGGSSKTQSLTINRIPFTRKVNTDLLDVTIPAGGSSSVIGFANSANADAAITITNTRTSAIVNTTADGNGGFSINIDAQSNDVLTFISEEQNICPPADPVSAVVPGVNHTPVLGVIGNMTMSLGETLSFVVSANDIDNDILTFSGIPLPSNASLDAMSGEFLFHPDEAQAGTVDIRFSVSDGIADDFETISLTVNPAPNDGITKMTGRVIDTTDFVNDGTETPVAGATVSIINSGTSAITAADGSFSLGPIPAGEQLFDIDPSGIAAPDGSDYAGFREAIHIIAKVDNQNDRPFFLPRIAMGSIKNVNPDAKTVIRNDDLGVRIEIPAHTAKWIDGSDYAGPMSISEVPDAVAPAALPPELGFGLLVTIQPVGVYFVNPVPIFFPNGDGLPEGSVVDIWSLDGGTGAFTVVGKAEVINNELKTVSGGVVSADWHGPLGGGTIQTTEDDLEVCDACQKLKALIGSETSLGQGSLSVRHDLVPYRSVGELRAPSMIYNSANADPRPLVTTKALLPSPRPQRLAVSVSYAGVGGSSQVVYDTSAMSPLDQVQLAGQFDGSALSSGIYDYALDITNVFAFSSVVTQQTGSTIINNKADSPIGSGWGIAGLNRLIEQPDQSVLMVGGGGSARVYKPLLEGSGKFGGPIAKPIGEWTRGGRPVVGDLNNDTWLDFIVPTTGASTQLDIFLNDGAGNFIYSQFATNQHPTSVALADFNEDNKLDVIVLGHGRADIHLGDGLGWFGAPTEISASTNNARAVVVADFNKDNHLDIAYANDRETTRTVSIQLGDGAGGFGAQSHIQTVRGNVRDVITDDFNNDNNPDIAVVADPNTDGWIAIFMGDGAGGFDAPIEILAGGRPVRLTSGDLNLDNNADILVALGAEVSVLYGNGDGSFATAETTPLPGASSCVSTGDFDGNGNPDFAVGTNGQQETVVLFDGNGMGGFPVRRRLGVGYAPACIIAADFNKDSLDDVVVIHGTSSSSKTLTIHMSDGPNNLASLISVPESAPGSFIRQMVIADFNEDQLPDIAVTKRFQVELYLGDGEDFGPPSIISVAQDAQDIQQADFNADGHVDLVFFRSSFEPKQGIEVRLGDGKGGFESIVRTNYPDDLAISGATNLSVGDFNQDGIPDLIYSNSSPGFQQQISPWQGNGDGTFTSLTPIDIANQPVQLKMFDVTGDGRADLISYNIARDIVVFEYDGAGGFNALAASPLGPSAGSFDGGDVNGDGIVDIVIGNSIGIIGGRIVTGIGDGKGAFTNIGKTDVCVSNSGSNSKIESLSLVDLDNDGDLDVVFTCLSNLVLGTALNDGNGVFTNQEVLITTAFDDMLVGDFNRDGALDIAAVSDRGMDVFHNIPTANRVGLRSPGSDYSVLTPNLDGSYTRRAKDGTITEFDADGLQTSVSDRNGNTTTYQYDGLKRLTKIIDPVNQETTFTYTGTRLSSVSDPLGRVTTFAHDGSGNLISITDPDLSVRQFAYDSRHRMIEQTSKRGFDTRYDYDQYGANWRTIRPDGSVVLVKPSATSALPTPGSEVGTMAMPLAAIMTEDVAATFTDGRGGVWSYGTNRYESASFHQDPLGRLTQVMRNGNNLPVRTETANGIITVRGYDKRGNLTSVGEAVGTPEERLVTMSYESVFNNVVRASDPSGRDDVFEYDGAGNLTRQINPMSDEKLFTYDARGRMLTFTDENTNLSSATYDAMGNVLTRVDSLLQTTTFDRDLAGNITMIEMGTGTAEVAQYTFIYDEMNRLTRLTDPNGNSQDWTYDTAGNKATSQSATGEITTYSYDELDRNTSIDSPATGLEMLNYDANGNLVSIIDARGDVRLMEYDVADQLIRVVDGTGVEESFGYDADGRGISTTNGNGETTTVSYNALNQVIAITDPDLEQQTFTYDAQGLLLSAINANGIEFSYSYDPLQRLLSRTAPDDTVLYDYDAVGNMLSATDNDSALSMAYNETNQMIQASTGTAASGQPVVTLDYSYDATGNRVSITDSDSGVSNTSRDGAGRLVSVETPGGKLITLSYDDADRLTGILRPNGVDSTYTYNAKGQLIDVSHGSLSQTIYSRDDIGDILSISDDVRDVDYSYDGDGRLIQADSSVDPEAYTYDGEGNRINSQLSATHSYDVANRLLANDDFSFSYDSAGRLLRRTSIDSGLSEGFVWDTAGRLIKYTDGSGTTSSYRYDALGRRIAKTVDGVTTGYVYDGKSIRNEYANNTTLTSQYDHGDVVDQPLAQASGGQQYYYLTDHQNSVTGLTDMSGFMINEYRYDAFGRSLSATTSVASPFRFTGREYDPESGLYFYRSRYYDPDAGRFITPDPIGSYSGDTNLYAYVGNNPLNRRDPSGLLTEKQFLEGVDTAATLIGLALTNIPAAGVVMKIFGVLKTGLTPGPDPGEPNTTRLSIFVTIFGGPVSALVLLGGNITKKIIDEYGDSLLALEDSKNNAARSEGRRIRREGDNNRRRAAYANGKLLEALCALEEKRKRIDGKQWKNRAEKEWQIKNNQSKRDRLREVLREVKKNPADAVEIVNRVSLLIQSSTE